EAVELASAITKGTSAALEVARMITRNDAMQESDVKIYRHVVKEAIRTRSELACLLTQIDTQNPQNSALTFAYSKLRKFAAGLTVKMDYIFDPESCAKALDT